MSRWEIGGPPISCTQNATAARSTAAAGIRRGSRTARNADNDVLVIGAGPAGMECALVLGKRGMRRVHLVDAATEIGGHLRWVPRCRASASGRRVVNYREIQLAKLRTSSSSPRRAWTPRTSLDYGAEIVVLATGSHWVGDGINGADPCDRSPAPTHRLPDVPTPEQIMLEGKELAGDSVVVYDTDGYFMGVSIAEKLALDGKPVTS